MFFAMYAGPMGLFNRPGVVTFYKHIGPMGLPRSQHSIVV